MKVINLNICPTLIPDINLYQGIFCVWAFVSQIQYGHNNRRNMEDDYNAAMGTRSMLLHRGHISLKVMDAVTEIQYTSK